MKSESVAASFYLSSQQPDLTVYTKHDTIMQHFQPPLHFLLMPQIGLNTPNACHLTGETNATFTLREGRGEGAGAGPGSGISQ